MVRVSSSSKMQLAFFIVLLLSASVPRLSNAGRSQIIEQVTVQQECLAEGATCIPYFQTCCDPYDCIFSHFTPGSDGKKIPNYVCKLDKE